MSSLKIPFGLFEGRLISPSEVKRGLECNCTCPGCGARLVANHPKSDIRAQYFSHYANTGCSKGYESAIHLAAKKILKENKCVLVPGISAEEHLFDKATLARESASKEIAPKLIELDRVEEEVREYDGVIPDIVAEIGDKKLFIEIAVTHFVDEIKLEKLKKLGFATFEICLDNLKETPTLDEIKELVIFNESNRTWIVNEKTEQLEKLVLNEAKRKLEVSKANIYKQRKKLQQEKAKYLSLSNTEKLNIELAFINVNLADVKSIIGINVKGQMSFGVENRVWQAAIYRAFIHGKQLSEFSTQEVLDFLSARFNIKAVFKDSPQISIYYYLKFLRDIGMIEYIYHKEYSVIKDIKGRCFPF